VPTSGYLTRPDYRVDLLRRRNHAVVRLGEATLASSRKAIFVDEQDHGLVVYFPRGDVDLSALVAVPGRATVCPYKGEASYWALAAAPTEPIAWSYEQPFAEVAGIVGYIAFYQDRVEVRLGEAN
jgi:uncharacterized protein (DUF427 family)